MLQGVFLLTAGFVDFIFCKQESVRLRVSGRSDMTQCALYNQIAKQLEVEFKSIIVYETLRIIVENHLCVSVLCQYV